jgi:hypothetical protein
MQAEDIPVVPVLSQIVRARINIYECVLNYGLKCQVLQYNENNECIKVSNVEIIGDDYNNWMFDDELEVLILSKCGLTKQQEPEP